MEKQTRMGMNRTGVQMSPMDLDRMVDDIQAHTTGAADGAGIAAVRTSYVTEADPLGTVPMPGSVKGALKAGVKKFGGQHPEVLIDKLGERLAFERGGVRLYDALLTKCRASGDRVGDMSSERLGHFRNEEAAHFRLVGRALEALGADPTAQTPSADVTGVEAMGLMKVVEDPRTSVAQALHAILLAELADHAGWELLIELARNMGQDQMVESFETALAEEQEHLSSVRRWYAQAVGARAG
jgi:rubrerythrin